MPISNKMPGEPRQCLFYEDCARRQHLTVEMPVDDAHQLARMSRLKHGRLRVGVWRLFGVYPGEQSGDGFGGVGFGKEEALQSVAAEFG